MTVKAKNAPFQQQSLLHVSGVCVYMRARGQLRIEREKKKRKCCYFYGLPWLNWHHRYSLPSLKCHLEREEEGGGMGGREKERERERKREREKIGRGVH